MTTLSGWHRGELIARHMLGLDKVPSTATLWSHISGEMPEQHSTFYTTRLPFLPVCILDDEGRPWGSVLAGKDGNTGFIHHPRYNTLSIEARLWKGDPFFQTLSTLNCGNTPSLIAGIGVEVSTRRRNKFAGHIIAAKVEDDRLNMQLKVNQAIGNCPKYITVRELTPYPAASPVIKEERTKLDTQERLSEDAIALILESDTVFFGTTYTAMDQDSALYPSHLGMNHRGGRPGFIRVDPSDGRTVVLPDFSGNRIMTSLGNIEATPRASLTFISFTSGDILYLTGNARNVYGSQARAIMHLQDTLTKIYITGYTLVRNALPMRQQRSDIQPSPYSPPIKLLAEETAHAQMFTAEQQPTATLTRIIVHNPTIATFEWEASSPLSIQPGQAAIMDFRPLLGTRQYQHMAAVNPNSVNDDFIRTWTVSSSIVPEDKYSRNFSLTIREKPGGTVTGALFSIVRKLIANKPEVLNDARVLSLKVNLAGISGEFILPPSLWPDESKIVDNKDNVQNLIFFAGGIGITPFLSMLTAISRKPLTKSFCAISLIISTREPATIISLLESSIGPEDIRLNLSIHIFTTASFSPEKSRLSIIQHHGRLQSSFFDQQADIFQNRNKEIYLCGPKLFEDFILDTLALRNIDRGSVHREGFEY